MTLCFSREFSISYFARDEEGKDTYLSLLSDWDLDAAFLGSSDPCLQLKVDLKPFEEGKYASNAIFIKFDLFVIEEGLFSTHTVLDIIFPHCLTEK